jgi:hypothetical protein
VHRHGRHRYQGPLPRPLGPTRGERREESALRRSGRTVPDRAYERFEPIDLAAVDDVLEQNDFDPKRLLQMLDGVQAAYGYLPVAALKRISFRTGAWYAFIYGTASYYGHLRFEPPTDATQAAAVSANRVGDAGYLADLDAALRPQNGGEDRPPRDRPKRPKAN